MRTHIKVVALINICLGLIGAFAGVAVFLGGTVGSLASGSFVGAIIGTVASTFIGLLIAALSLVSVVAGVGLLNGKSWARWVMIVVSIFHLFRFPWMTVFGVYSLWVLFHAETTNTFQAQKL